MTIAFFTAALLTLFLVFFAATSRVNGRIFPLGYEIRPRTIAHELELLKRLHRRSFQIDGHWEFYKEDSDDKYIVHRLFNITRENKCQVTLTVKMENVPLFLRIGNPHINSLLPSLIQRLPLPKKSLGQTKELLVNHLPEELREILQSEPIWLEDRELKISTTYDCKLDASTFPNSMRLTLNTVLECARRLKEIELSVPIWLIGALKNTHSPLDRVQLLQLLCYLYPYSSAVRELCEDILHTGNSSEQVVASLYLEETQHAVNVLCSEYVTPGIWEEVLPILVLQCPREQLEPVFDTALMIDSPVLTQLVLKEAQGIGIVPNVHLLIKSLKEGHNSQRLALLARQMRMFETEKAEIALLELYEDCRLREFTVFDDTTDDSKNVTKQVLLSLGKIGTARSLPAIQEDESSEAKDAAAKIKARISSTLGDATGHLTLADDQKSGQLAVTEHGGDLTVVD